jgi:2-polyprenyl-3-methyl-5-hydroxy-6-metoxy-1,4-benzoquinol methylase
LNEFALQRNVSRLSKVRCYDIFQANGALRQRFDTIFLFDVLEHIADEDQFLAALKFHLAPGGRVVLNVPAGQ